MTREEKLEALLKKNTIRLQILQGRMRACNEEAAGNHDQHDLSIWEIDGWVEENDEALDG